MLRQEREIPPQQRLKSRPELPTKVVGVRSVPVVPKVVDDSLAPTVLEVVDVSPVPTVPVVVDISPVPATIPPIPPAFPKPLKVLEPIPEDQQRELFKWILEEKRNVKPKNRKEKKIIDEEKAILERFICSESIPRI